MGGLFESLSGASALRAEGKSAQNIANFNAAVARQTGVAAKAKAKFGQKRQAESAARTKSALIAKIAVGGGLDSPVTADIIAEQAAELELENLLIGFEGEVAAQQAESQAQLDLLQGRLSKAKGKAAARSANVQFGIQLATLGVGGGSPPQPGSVSAGSGGGGARLGRNRSFLTGFA